MRSKKYDGIHQPASDCSKRRIVSVEDFQLPQGDWKVEPGWSATARLAASSGDKAAFGNDLGRQKKYLIVIVLTLRSAGGVPQSSTSGAVVLLYFDTPYGTFSAQEILPGSHANK